jgi:hypothetical protein
MVAAILQDGTNNCAQSELQCGSPLDFYWELRCSCQYWSFIRGYFGKIFQKWLRFGARELAFIGGRVCGNGHVMAY